MSYSEIGRKYQNISERELSPQGDDIFYLGYSELWCLLETDAYYG